MTVCTHLQAPLASTATKTLYFGEFLWVFTPPWAAPCLNVDTNSLVSPFGFLIRMDQGFGHAYVLTWSILHKNCVYGWAERRGQPSEKSYSSLTDASHLIGKRGEPITASRSAPQAASLFFIILDGLEGAGEQTEWVEKSSKKSKRRWNKKNNTKGANAKSSDGRDPERWGG